MTGIATNVCVESTARADAVLHEGTLENMRRHFGVVASATDIIATWKSTAQSKKAVG